MWRLSSLPFVFCIVYKSSIVWVGCWLLPSPPFMTGIEAASAASLAEPSSECLITITSAYCWIILIVSHKDSPFWVEVTFAFEKPITCPDNWFIDDVKLSFVLVEGSKKSVARIFPFSRLLLGLISICFTTLRVYKSSSFEKSLIDIISLFLKSILKKRMSKCWYLKITFLERIFGQKRHFMRKSNTFVFSKECLKIFKGGGSTSTLLFLASLTQQHFLNLSYFFRISSAVLANSFGLNNPVYWLALFFPYFKFFNKKVE